MASSSTAQQQAAPQKVAKFREILNRGPYAAGMSGETKNDPNPQARVIPVSWKCGQKKKDGRTCKKVNGIHRTTCSECGGFATDPKNVKRDKDHNPIQAGDDLNMIPGRLRARYWECPSCFVFRDITAATVTGALCDNCYGAGEEIQITNLTWVYNCFEERLGTFDGMKLVELNPWMDNLWAVCNRINHGIAYSIVE